MMIVLQGLFRGCWSGSFWICEVISKKGAQPGLLVEGDINRMVNYFFSIVESKREACGPGTEQGSKEGFRESVCTRVTVIRGQFTGFVATRLISTLGNMILQIRMLQ